MKYLKYFENINNTNIYGQNIKTLKGLNIPKNIDGNFYCSSNNLTSLEFCAKYVGGNFNCDFNELTSLEYGPETVGGDFNCADNKLTSLKFCPKNINKDFNCSTNILTSLEYCPKTIGGNFNCYNNQLTSLEYFPETISGFINCLNNPWNNPISYELIMKHDIEKILLYTNEQEEKFGSYDFQKQFLTNTPEKYKDLELIGYNPKIKEEFDWLFNAADMRLI